MRSPIHPEGFRFVALFGVISLAIHRLSRWASALFALLAGFSLYFFRDPDRAIPSGEGVIVSPADGRVVGIERIEQVPFLDGPAQRISIFLSIFDVHINRAPIEGKVTWRQYNAGCFLPAYAPKASLDNEQNSVGIDDGGYKVMVRQIAGIIARRIICWTNPGDLVARGDRIGLIRFGSRTDLFLPLSARIAVTVGQKVQGGSTVIAHRS